MSIYQVFISDSNRGLGLEFAKQYVAYRWIVLACYHDPEAVIA
ncbi:hypothetical protein MCEMSEM29_00536 [Methylophilaceae bacterium]|jgi:hypothetical protein